MRITNAMIKRIALKRFTVKGYALAELKELRNAFYNGLYSPFERIIIRQYPPSSEHRKIAVTQEIENASIALNKYANIVNGLKVLKPNDKQQFLAIASDLKNAIKEFSISFDVGSTSSKLDSISQEFQRLYNRIEKAIGFSEQPSNLRLSGIGTQLPQIRFDVERMLHVLRTYPDKPTLAKAIIYMKKIAEKAKRLYELNPTEKTETVYKQVTYHVRDLTQAYRDNGDIGFTVNRILKDY